MLRYIGETRTEWCRDCEKQTSQVLRHLAKNGMGESVAERWECIPGRHWVGDLPRPVPAELRALDPS
jgi:hypothetical protein